MKLKAPQGTTYIQTHNKVYELDSDNCIEVQKDSPDMRFFMAKGFQELPVSKKKNCHEAGTAETAATAIIPAPQKTSECLSGGVAVARSLGKDHLKGMN